MTKRLKRGSSISNKLVPIIFWTLIALSIVAFFFAQKNYIRVNKLVYENNNIPRQYSGFKIAHISNIDNETINILNKIKKEEPDIILVSGGLVDKNGNYKESVKLLNELSNITSTLFVLQKADYAYANEIIGATSATCISNNYITLQGRQMTAEQYIEENCDKGIIKEASRVNSDISMYIDYITLELEKDSTYKIQILGLDGSEDDIYKFKDNLYTFNDDKYAIRILVLGNEKYAEQLTNTGIDIVLSGGTYGLDENTNYKSGLYNISDYTLIISPGICKSIPNNDRFLNLPEIQIITLSDNNVYKRNFLERLLDKFVIDTGTIFDNDEGFKEYTESYGMIEDELNKTK